MKHFIIAIDGPAAAGKSTLAKEVAKRLGFYYIDSGALFRAVTYKIITLNIELNNTIEIINATKDIDINFINDKIFLDGKNIEQKIRDSEISSSVSQISKIPEIRRIIEEFLHKASLSRDIVVDGRDIGTAVFPNAYAKFYITASIDVRAKRRFKELKEKNKQGNFENIKNQLVKRDLLDSSRNLSPLKKAEDAVLFNTDNMSIQEVVDKIVNIIKNKEGKDVLHSN